MQNTNHSELPLIRTKLAPPKVSQAPVNRNALLLQLDQRRDRRLSLVIGPSGCGKTMLLTQWRRQLLLQGAVVAWYNAGPDDDDPQVAAYLVESLRLAGLDISTEALSLYIRSGGKAWKPLLAALINDLSDHDGEVYIVIDDLHYLSSFSILQLLDRWIALAPANIHLVLGSRRLPPLDLGRLRAQDQLTELRFGELRFGLEETQRFIEAQGLVGLSPAQVNTLHEMSDGWAAGLQLLTFSLRKHKTPEAFFKQRENLSLSQETALEEFLEGAAAEHLSDAELGFLTQISACRRFNRELCEILTGDPRAAEYLRKFESENLFLIPIDTSDSEPWYRFHRLFASFLNARLQRRDPDDARQLHHQASRWFAAKSLHVEAMRHAMLAQDSDFVVELIDRAARRMINDANFMQFLDWCDSVPYERLRMRLNVCLCAAWAQLSCGRIEDFGRTIADVTLHPEYRKPEIALEVELLKAYHAMCQDDTAASLRIVEPMQEAPPSNPFHVLLMWTIASLSLVYANEFERAREVARWRHRYAIPERPGHPRPLVDVVLGLSHLVQGNIRLAIHSLQPFIEHALQTASFGADAAGLFSGYLLEAYYQAGQIEQARNFLEHHWDLIDVVGFADALLMAHRVRARIELLDGNPAAARETLKRLEEIGYRKNLDRLIAWSLYEQLRLAQQSAQGGSASELLRRLQQLGGRYRDERNCVRSEIPLAALMAQAEMSFSHSPDSSCLPAINAADAAARAGQRQLLSTQLGFLKAIVMLRQDSRDAALELGRSLVGHAAEAGMLRLLPDIGTAAQPLIAALLEMTRDEDERDYLEAAALALTPGGGAVVPAPGGAKAKATPLSAREQEVLELLARALSIKSIARALNLSPGTVKWHLKNIYGKLGAVSREDVLAKSRMLGVLP